MIDDTDELFEQRLCFLLAKTRGANGLELTTERMERLRALVPIAPADHPSLTLVWRRMADGIAETLSILRTSDPLCVENSSSLLRDGNESAARLEMVSFPLYGGELRAQVIPGENRSAKVLLSVKGSVAERDDLFVELSLGRRLIEARPLEQKAEVTVNGAGNFGITLFAGDSHLGTIHLNIEAAEDPGDA